MNSDELTELVLLLEKACLSLMDELGNKKAADWGIINDALCSVEDMRYHNGL